MRFFGSDKYPLFEIANHPEPILNNGNREQNILHFHKFNGLERKDTVKMTDEVKEQYKDYLKEFGLYDKC